MNAFKLKKPIESYPGRFNRFLWLLVSVRGMEPRDMHLWRVMDGVAFEDTETALETELHNEGCALDEKRAERLTLALIEGDRGASASEDTPRGAVND